MEQIKIFYHGVPLGCNGVSLSFHGGITEYLYKKLRVTPFELRETPWLKIRINNNCFRISSCYLERTLCPLTAKKST
jgi:hypothetical protein